MGQTLAKAAEYTSVAESGEKKLALVKTNEDILNKIITFTETYPGMNTVFTLCFFPKIGLKYGLVQCHSVLLRIQMKMAWAFYVSSGDAADTKLTFTNALTWHSTLKPEDISSWPSG